MAPERDDDATGDARAIKITLKRATPDARGESADVTVRVASLDVDVGTLKRRHVARALWDAPNAESVVLIYGGKVLRDDESLRDAFARGRESVAAYGDERAPGNATEDERGTADEATAAEEYVVHIAVRSARRRRRRRIRGRRRRRRRTARRTRAAARATRAKSARRETAAPAERRARDGGDAERRARRGRARRRRRVRSGNARDVSPRRFGERVRITGVGVSRRRTARVARCPRARGVAFDERDVSSRVLRRVRGFVAVVHAAGSATARGSGQLFARRCGFGRRTCCERAHRK